MPVILPTPEELARAPWRVQDQAHRRLRDYARQLADLEAQAAHDSERVRRRMARLEAQITEAGGIRAEAARLLEQLPLDEPHVIAQRRWELLAATAPRRTRKGRHLRSVAA